MDENNLLNNRLFGRTVGLLSRALDHRVKNHSVMSANVSNIDTPGYKHKELPFDEELRRAANSDTMNLRKTDRQHFPNLSHTLPKNDSSLTLETLDDEDGAKSLDIDKEMAKMSQNNILYEATVKVLTKKFEALRTVLEEKR